MQMAAMTYHVVIAFMRFEDGDIGATEPHCGALAFSRTGDPSVGEFEDAVILKKIGEVDEALLLSAD
jgi:hypothetical protein